MDITVQKYGGSSLATDRQLDAVAERVALQHGTGAPLIIVVSARGDTTDQLIRTANTISAEPCPNETDKLLATGELAAAAQLAIALGDRGVPAVSLSGPQAGLWATGRPGEGVIATVDTDPVRHWLARGHVVVVAGFQALTVEDDIITLGRGGSDTSAVALAVAHGARVCEIYTDVDGVHPADPRIVGEARVLPAVDASVMAEMAYSGARVMHARAVELAAAHDTNIVVRNAFGQGPGSTIVGRNGLMFQSAMLEERVGIAAVTHDVGVAKVVIRAGANRCLSGLSEVTVLDILADRQIAVDAVTWWSPPTEDMRMTFCVRTGALDEARDALNPLVSACGGTVDAQRSIGKVSIVGTGLLSRPGLTAAALAELTKHGIAAECVSCTPTRTSMLVPEERVRDAVLALYRWLGLDRDDESGHEPTTP